MGSGGNGASIFQHVGRLWDAGATDLNRDVWTNGIQHLFCELCNVFRIDAILSRVRLNVIDIKEIL